MAYIINRYDGTQLTIVDDGALDVTTSISLVGRNYTGYGEIQNENMIFLLENFAGGTSPARPISGQAWYDTDNKSLKVYNGSEWLAAGNATVSDTEPAHSNGGLWLKNSTQQIFVSDGTTWRLVGPEAVEGFNITRVVSTTLNNVAGNVKPVIITYVDGDPLSIYAYEDFTIGALSPVPGFSQLVRGLNFKSNASIQANLIGSSTKAESLTTPRFINGTEFDGTEDIVVTASTTGRINPGNYILGRDWNGGFDETWSVDATSENLIGKIVARDSTGSFSATSINTVVYGELVGNVTSTSGTSLFNDINVAGGITAPDGVVKFPDNIRITGAVIGNLQGNVTGNLQGTVTGTVVGSASLNLLKSGDSMTGNLNWNNTGLGLNWDVANDSASIKFYNTSEFDNNARLEFNTSKNNNEYFRWTHTDSLGNLFESMRLVPNTSGNGSLVVSGDVTVTGNINGTFVGDGVSITNINADNIASGRVSNARLTGTYNINISGQSSTVGSVPSSQIISELGFTPANKAGDNFTSDIIIGSTTKTSDTTVSVRAGDSFKAGFEAYGNNQGTGYLYVGQSTTYGGGISYNGDNNPGFISGESADHVTFFRRNAGVNSEVFSYSFSSDNVTFNGIVSATFSGNGSSITNLNPNNISGTIPSAKLNGTYNINITGNAITATNATTAAQAITSNTSIQVTNAGRITAESNGTSEANGIRMREVYNNGYPTSYGNAITLGGAGGNQLLLGWSGASGAHADNYIRSRRDVGSIWSPWAKIITDANYNSYSPTLSGSGASGTWGINISGNANTATRATNADKAVFATSAGTATTATTAGTANTATNATNATNASFAATQASTDNSTRIATTAFVKTQIATVPPVAAYTRISGRPDIGYYLVYNNQFEWGNGVTTGDFQFQIYTGASWPSPEQYVILTENTSYFWFWTTDTDRISTTTIENKRVTSRYLPSDTWLSFRVKVSNYPMPNRMRIRVYNLLDSTPITLVSSSRPLV